VTELSVAGDDDSHGLAPGFDISVAHPARVYDYWLGGKDHFEPDRVVAEQVIAARPTIIRDIRANRAFLGRVVPTPSWPGMKGSPPGRCPVRSTTPAKLTPIAAVSTITSPGAGSGSGSSVMASTPDRRSLGGSQSGIGAILG
jgi:S-adenosyl methyltransferase